MTSIANYGVSAWTQLPETPGEKEKGLELRERRADTRTLAAVHLCAYYRKTFDTFCFYPRHCDSAPTRRFLTTLGTYKHTDMHQHTFTCRTRATVIPAFLSNKTHKQKSDTLNCLNCHRFFVRFLFSYPIFYSQSHCGKQQASRCVRAYEILNTLSTCSLSNTHVHAHTVYTHMLGFYFFLAHILVSLWGLS